MNDFEWVAATIFALLGVRSLVHWLRNPLTSDDRRDQVLFALFVLGRAGLWFALGGLFAIYGTIDVQGRAFADEAGDLRWYLMVLAVPSVLQLLTAFLLGRDPGADR